MHRAGFGPSPRTDLVGAPPRGSIPGERLRECREVGKPAGGRGHRYVAALAAKPKTQRHAKTRPRRVILLQLGAGNTKGGRTHYLAESGVHWGNQHAPFLIKKRKAPSGKTEDAAACENQAGVRYTIAARSRECQGESNALLGWVGGSLWQSAGTLAG
jgi:hypothetical protein